MTPEVRNQKTGRFAKFSSISFVLLLLLAGGSVGLLTTHAAGTPTLQYGPTVLSGSATTAKEPAVSTSSNGSDVYVAWTQGSGGIYFVMSSNGGSSFSSPVKISLSGGTAQFPVMITGDGYQSANAGDVYVAWVQTVSGKLQPFVAVSTNNGGSFKTTQLSTAGGITPALAAAGSDVYVTWYQTTSCPATALNKAPTQGCIYVDSSSNNGSTWTTPVELNPSSKGEAQVVASGELRVRYRGWYLLFQFRTGWNLEGQRDNINGMDDSGAGLRLLHDWKYDVVWAGAVDCSVWA